jgi:orotate phosphoribosyltransferase
MLAGAATALAEPREMHEYQQRFVEFLLQAEALRIGDFQLKSGRRSPLFLNTGLLDTGSRLAHVGRAYAATLLERVGARGFDVVFGPAYKGIPLAVATVVALSESGVEKPYLADRKEAKFHGAEASGGDLEKRILGRRPAPDARYVLVDDVLTTGGTKDEAVDLLRLVSPAARFVALLVILDRQETTPDGADAVASFTARTGIPVLPVLRVTEVVDHLVQKGALTSADAKRCTTYWATYGTETAMSWDGSLRAAHAST